MKRAKPPVTSPMKGIVLVPSANMKPRILIADDDESIRDIFRLILSDKNYILELKENGQDILDNKFTIPDLFLIDKQLSGICGLDVCMHLKSQERTKHIPVVMISASPDIQTLSKKAGADGFIEKPFDIAQFREMISKYTAMPAPHVHQ